VRILFDNILRDGALSCVNEDPNYPLENLLSPILKKRWQSTVASDVITIDFGGPVPINSLFLGWTNADTVGIDVLGAADVILYSVGRTVVRLTEALDERITEAGDTRLVVGAYYDVQYNNGESFFFTEVQAYKVQIQLDTTDLAVFLGGIGVGMTETLPDPLDTWVERFQDNSAISEGQHGQVLQSYIRPLAQYAFEHRNLTYVQKNYWKDLYLNAGRGKNVWCDFFEGNHDYMKPVFCTILNALEIQKPHRIFSLKWAFREAR